jgi:hypothetical protein
VARLVPHPLGDLGPSLQRIESAVVDLRGDLGHVDQLPSIHEQLAQVNSSLGTLIELIEALRGDLVALAASR